MNVLITGAAGFIGKNLVAHLRLRNGLKLFPFDINNSEKELNDGLQNADVIYHLAGVNRPIDASEFESGNVMLTARICDILSSLARKPKIVMTSSVQAELDNPYGRSKLRAEKILKSWAAGSGARVRIYRLKNVFGKWCRPNYNSVVATFCHNIANDQPIKIDDPHRTVSLMYIDDVVQALLAELGEVDNSADPAGSIPSFEIILSDLAGRIQTFRDMREHLLAPDFSSAFNRALYATYLSYVPHQSRRQPLLSKGDDRGSLAEFMKSRAFGQIFVSRTNPGITRGNHYHHTKAEKFLVVNGQGIVRMRAIDSQEVVEYRVRGEDYHVIDIPPGFTHSIENIGDEVLTTLFWASEIFDPDRPDTYYLPVLDSKSCNTVQK